jgi:secondary thiamine-phosphate synthase enzyme
MQSTIKLKTSRRTELIDITSRVRTELERSAVAEGMCTVFVPHTTAGVTINEAADPSVAQDVLQELDKVIPIEDGYSHYEGNSAAHIKAVLVGSSCQIPISGGKLSLGTWQGIFFCEFDGPRSRTVRVAVIGG